MHMITCNLIGSVISGSLNGEQFGVTYDEAKYKLMKELEKKANDADTMQKMYDIIEEFKPLTQESYKEIVEHTTPYLFVNKATNQFFLKYYNEISSNPLPRVFVDKIITSVEKKIDIAPLIKCMAKFMRHSPGRPNYTENRAKQFAEYIDANYVNSDMVGKLMDEKGLAREVAIALGTTKQVAITQEGLIAGYKVSKEVLHRYELNDNEEVVEKSRYGKDIDPDTGLVTYNKPEFVEERLFQPCIMEDRGDEFYCGDKLGHFIRVGHVHFLDDWKKVGNPGSKGLHIGGLAYIKGYQTEGTVTHNVFADPMHIFGMINTGNGLDGAMTTKQYFVHSSFAGPNKGIYHSSKYAAITDAEYAKLVEEAVMLTQEKMDDLVKEANEREDLM